MKMRSMPSKPRAPRTSEVRTSLDDLVRLRQRRGVSISVCLPALNEAATIGAICTRCRSLMDAGLIQQLVVVDSGSIDGTVEVARAGGAEVYEARHLLQDEAPEPLGKGGALWKSLAVARSDIVVWMDSDTANFGQHFVTSLVEPLLSDGDIRMTKAFYDRPLQSNGVTLSTGGARVTELAFRPLAHLLFPELVDIVQPLSGEYAGYRDDLVGFGFFSGYGVDAGLLIDFVTTHGLSSIVQVDLGARLQRNQEILALGRMAFQVMQVMMLRSRQQGRFSGDLQWPSMMRQFESRPHGARPVDHHVQVRELPPMKSVLSTTARPD